MADSAVRGALEPCHSDAATPSLPARPRTLPIHIPEASEMRDQRELSPRGLCAGWPRGALARPTTMTGRLMPGAAGLLLGSRAGVCAVQSQGRAPVKKNVALHCIGAKSIRELVPPQARAPARRCCCTVRRPSTLHAAMEAESGSQRSHRASANATMPGTAAASHTSAVGIGVFHGAAGLQNDGSAAHAADEHLYPWSGARPASSFVHAASSAALGRPTQLSATQANRLAAVRAEAAHLRAMLADVRVLHTQAAALLAVAVENSQPFLREARRLTNAPARSHARLSARALVTQLRRNINAEFFVDYFRDAPPPNVDAVARVTDAGGAPRTMQAGFKWTPVRQAELAVGVYAVSLMREAEAALAAAGVAMPDAARPLGGTAPSALPGLVVDVSTPGAAASYVHQVLAAAAAGLAAVPPAGVALLRARLQALADAPRGTMLAAAGADNVDWVRVTHGGFFPLRVQNGLTPADAKVRWLADERPGVTRGPWSELEDAALRKAAATHDYRDWAAIAAASGTGRSTSDCFIRWQRALNPALQRRGWTAEDDTQLALLVAELGTRDWGLIAERIPGRKPVQVRALLLPD
jgi:hypothetical protein